jgi:hypothetical protein
LREVAAAQRAPFDDDDLRAEVCGCARRGETGAAAADNAEITAF